MKEMKEQMERLQTEVGQCVWLQDAVCGDCYVYEVATCTYVYKAEWVQNFNPLILSTVKPLNNGHTEGRSLVRCRGVVPISEVE